MHVEVRVFDEENQLIQIVPLVPGARRVFLNYRISFEIAVVHRVDEIHRVDED